MKARSLAELARLRESLTLRDDAAPASPPGRRMAHAAGEAAHRPFSDAVGAVTPLPPHGRTMPVAVRPAPWPRQRELDERAALAESMSDEVDLESLLLTDDGLSFRREGVGSDVLTRLRRGHWAIQAELDLHGLRRDEARERLAAFVRGAVRRGQRCLRVVHGKGHGSPGRQPVLKGRVQRWLGQNAEVIAFAQASGPMGGAGALLVLLKGHRAPGRAGPDGPTGADRTAAPGKSVDTACD